MPVEGVEIFRVFHPVLAGFPIIGKYGPGGQHLTCPRSARKRAQVSSTPCSSASAGGRQVRRCVWRTTDPGIVL